MTLFRLALNISSSRLILIHGNRGTRATGQVIEAFGNFVVGGSYILGVVISLVLIAIQYVVINHGAVRISEVTAHSAHIAAALAMPRQEVELLIRVHQIGADRAARAAGAS